jgi:general L-amino acid transport system permease protein
MNAATTADPATAAGGEQTRPPFWRDVRVLRVVAQVVAVAAVLLTLRWLLNNLFTNLDEQNISRSFDVVEQPTNFSIRDSGFESRHPLWQAFVVGIQNTAVAAFVGILIASVLGTLIGIGRLSDNWMVAKASQIYVETLRNIPPLVVIIFFSAAVFVNGPLPALNPSSEPVLVTLPGMDSPVMVLSNDRNGIPSFATDDPTSGGDNVGLFWALMAGALVVAVAAWIWRTRVHIATGAPHRRVLWSFGSLLGLGAVAFVALGGPYRWSLPAVSESGRLIEGGLVTNAGYLSITLALGLYTASHIAEIIRGSIQAVPKGQTEAANALALTGSQRYRYVVLPQALRIAIPPIINQFLNLTKNTSLATAVAYPEITAIVKTAIGNGKPAVQLLVILMAIYLTFSIVISLIMNLVNSRMQLVGR